MLLPAAFGTQVAAIMDVLAKAAVAEITKLAEEESVVLHMEMRRRDSEIRELQRSLEMMKAELCKAQEAAVNPVPVKDQEQTAAGSRLQRRDKKEDQEKGEMYSELNSQYSPCEPQNVMEESHNRAMVKQEPAGELPTAEITDNTGTADVCSAAGEQHDSIWPAPACDLFGKNCGAMQQLVEIFPFHAEEYSACKETESLFNSLSTSKETSDDCLAVPIKVEVTMPPTCMRSTPSESAHNEHFSHDSHHDECVQSALQQEDSSIAFPQAQRPTAGISGSSSEDVMARNSFRAKRQMNVWRTNQRLFFCSVCNKGFARLSQLEEHKTSHQTFKPFRCLECGKSFTQKTRLKTHQSVHTGERPFSCKICGKMFSRQDNCLRHERFHSGLKPYSCRQCGKSFTVLGNLKIHQEIHLQGR